MIIFISILFVLAALGGIYLLSYILQNKNTPKAVSIIHGTVATLSLLLLICYAIFFNNSLLISIIFFIFAALLGVTLFYRDITGKPLPKWLAIGHGLSALIGFIFLFVFGMF